MTHAFPLSPFRKNSDVRTRWIPEVAGNLRVSYERLLRQLDLLARARQEAVENRPKRADKDLDVAQREALDAVEGGGNLLRQFLDARLAEARDLILARTPQLLDDQVTAQRAELDLRRAKLADKQTLMDLRKDERRAFRQMEDFKRRHRITHQALYSDDLAKVSAQLIFLCLIETVANVLVFQMAGGGLAGGLSYALGFSLVNIVLGLLTGVFAIRLLWHAFVLPRVIGVIGAAIGLSSAVWFNLLVAHYRESLEASQSQTFAAAFERSVSPAQIGDLGIYSVCLFLLGLIIFALSLHKGVGGEHSPVDTYFMYRRHARPWRHANQAYTDAKNRCLERMKSSIAAAEDRAHEWYKEEARQVAEALDIAEQAVQRAGEVSDSITEWREMGATLLTAYRDENRAVRTDPEPAYFSVFPDLRAMVKGLPDGQDLRRLAETAADIHRQNIARTTKLNHALSDLLARELDSFIAFLGEVETDVDRELVREAAIGLTQSDIDTTASAPSSPARPLEVS